MKEPIVVPSVPAHQLFFVIVGVVFLGGLLLFGIGALARRALIADETCAAKLQCDLIHVAPAQISPKSVILDALIAIFERRNDLWSSYGQLSVAVLVATLLTVLLLTRVISAEAGLPILSGISGFALANAGAQRRSRPPGKEQ